MHIDKKLIITVLLASLIGGIVGGIVGVAMSSSKGGYSRDMRDGGHRGSQKMMNGYENGNRVNMERTSTSSTTKTQ